MESHKEKKKEEKALGRERERGTPSLRGFLQTVTWTPKLELVSDPQAIQSPLDLTRSTSNRFKFKSCMGGKSYALSVVRQDTMDSYRLTLYD